MIPIKVTLLFKAILQFSDSKLEKLISLEKYSLTAMVSLKIIANPPPLLPVLLSDSSWCSDLYKMEAMRHSF